MIIGIDLGTTNSCAAVICDGVPVFVKTGYSRNPYLLPSVVGYGTDGEILVGEAAKNQMVLYPDRTIRSVKRSMGKTESIALLNPASGETVAFSPAEISAKILARLKELATRQFEETIDRAVITVPAYFGEHARRATIEAGELAGLTVERLVNEPTAAALCFGLGHPDLQNHVMMVYDLGGGTFDISLLEYNGEIMEVKASDGDSLLGGDDFDEALLGRCLQSLKDGQDVDLTGDRKVRSVLRDCAENCKIALSSSYHSEIRAEYLAKKGLRAIHLRDKLSRNVFNDLISSYIDRTESLCRRVLTDAKVATSAIKQVLLVGGSTRIPAVREMLETRLDLTVSQEVDPDLAVTVGAAIQAAIIEGRDVRTILVDVVPHSLSVSCLSDHLGFITPNYCRKLIKKNVPMPCTVEDRFTTLHDDQDKVEIKVYQGEGSYEPENVLLDTFLFDNLVKRAAGKTGIMVSFSYNLNGTVDVKVAEEGTTNTFGKKISLNRKPTEESNRSL